MRSTQPPTISFIIPTHPDWEPYAKRFLVSLAMQTCHDFEVVFGVDGGGNEPFEQLAEQDWPFSITVVAGERPKGDIPHRNHARNAAIRAARGRYAWVADTDFLWAEHAVEHAVAAIKSADAAGEMISVTPVLMRIDMDPTLYVSHTAEWGPDGQPVTEFIGSLPTDKQEWAGQGDLYVGPDSGPRIVDAPVKEGFPLVPIEVLHALDLFDERFVRWGGNKIELTYRLTSLAGIGLPYRLLASVAAWHQPHPQDPNKPRDDHHRLANEQMYYDRVRQVRGESDWWIAQRRAVQQVLLRHRRERLADDEKSEPAKPGMTVGVVTVGDRRKGLYRDAELVEACLQCGPQRRRGSPDPNILRYTLDNPRAFIDAATPSLEGVGWPDFLERVDVVVLFEFLPVKAISAALARGVRVVYVPNADWAEIGGDVNAWVNMVRGLALRTGFEVWAKTPAWGDVLNSHRIKNRVCPWIALDEVARDRPPPKAPVRFFASIGMGGYQGRRGLDEILAAWRLVADKHAEGATLTIKSAKPLPKDADVPGGVHVIVADWTRDQIRAAWLDADVVLYPTKWDGFGLSLSEALNAGCPVIAPNVWPMNEQVIDGHNGLLLDVPYGETFRLAPRAEVAPGQISRAMVRLIEDPDLLRRLTCPQPALRRAQQRAMRTWVRWRLLDEPEPSVLIVRGDGASPAGGRRSELWWADAFRACGLKPLVVTRSELHAIDPDVEADLAIIGKGQRQDVDRLRGVVGSETPIVCWHLDLTDLTEARDRWQREMVQVCDLCVVSEGDLERYSGGRIVTIYPGQEISAVRSTGALVPVADVAPVVFLGGCFGAHDSRAAIVRAVDATVYGDPRQWLSCGVQAEPPAYGPAAAGVYGGSVGLSVSRVTSRSGYTSNRLFNLAAAGALPLVQRFKGCDELIPAGAAVYFDDARDVASARGEIHSMGENGRWQTQWAATEWVWRRHTWEDAVLKLLDEVQPQVRERPKPKPKPVGGAEFSEMWDRRAQQLGPRAVAHISWTEPGKFEQATGEWWKIFKRHLGRMLKPWHQRVLDFGCGVGRFTRLLHDDLGRDAVGVDVSPTMVNMARDRNRGIDFRVIEPTQPLPFGDDTFDVVFTSTVLQHVPDAEFKHLVSELRRVLRPGGVAFLFENTHRARVRSSLSGHVVFRPEDEYRQHFPGVGELESIMVEGEKHSVMAGRIR